MKPIAPNTLLQNRYLIVHLIGKGGMGEVYLAVDQRLGSAIALKRTFFSDHETLGNAFEREARTLARLRHPVLPKVSDHFTEADMQYLVMDHIAGEDLSNRLEAAQKPFPLSWVLFWADQLLDALNYLHTHEPPIIHRDIKPQNLKLTDENNIVLLDFGLSKNNAELNRKTTTGSIVGYTTQYAPMEQIRGTGTDARSDIYSLSATLYQLLTNIVPEDAITRADAVISGKPDPIYPINTLNPEVSKVVSDVILKGMAISQEQRYVNARTMQKALREAYAQVQGEISAKTAAFKALNQPTVPQSQQATEVMPPVLSQNTNLSASETPSTPAISGLSSVPSPLQKRVQPEEDFDATIRIDSQPNDSLPKQSDIKTEVLITGISPEITSAQAEEFNLKENLAENKNFSQAENFDRKNDFAKADDFGTNQNFSPDVTLPLVSFDSQQAEKSVSVDTAADFDSATFVREGVSAAAFVPTQKNLPSDEVRPQTPIQMPPNKSYGKTLAVGSGLGAFLILAIGGAYLAWYTLGGSGTTTINNTPSSSPQATVEVSITPAPTLEAVTNSSNSGETDYVNPNTDVKIAEQTDDKTKPGTKAQPTPGKTATPRPTPQIVTAKTPPPTKSVAKKTPAKGDRTDILQ